MIGLLNDREVGAKRTQSSVQKLPVIEFGLDGLAMCVDLKIPSLADCLRCAGMSEAVGHLLGEMQRAFEVLGEFASGERLPPDFGRREKLPEIVRGSESDRPDDLA